MVTVESSTSRVLGAAVIVYLVPFLLFFAGYFLCAAFRLSSGVSAAVGVAGFALGLLLAVLWDRGCAGSRPFPSALPPLRRRPDVRLCAPQPGRVESAGAAGLRGPLLRTLPRIGKAARLFRPVLSELRLYLSRHALGRLEAYGGAEALSGPPLVSEKGLHLRRKRGCGGGRRNHPQLLEATGHGGGRSLLEGNCRPGSVLSAPTRLPPGGPGPAGV